MLDDVLVKSEQLDKNTTELTYTFKITKPIEEKTILVNAWNDKKSGWKNYFIDALTVEYKGVMNSELTEINEQKNSESNTICPAPLTLVMNVEGQQACIHDFHVEIWQRFGWNLVNY